MLVGHDPAKFLGGVFRHRNMTWEFQDGSGVPLTEEFRSELLYYASIPDGGACVGLMIDKAVEDRMRGS